VLACLLSLVRATLSLGPFGREIDVLSASSSTKQLALSESTPRMTEAYKFSRQLKSAPNISQMALCVEHMMFSVVSLQTSHSVGALFTYILDSA
jgi:hypothetical protein